MDRRELLSLSSYVTFGTTLNTTRSLLLEMVCADEIEAFEAEIEELREERDNCEKTLNTMESKLADTQSEIAELKAANEQLRTSNTIDFEPTVEERERVDLAHELREQSWFDELDYWWPMNEKYKTPTEADFGEATDRLTVDENTYTDNFFDCVDFATALRAEFAMEFQINAIGTVITRNGRPHAFNAVYTADEGMLLWEPQFNQTVGANEGDRYQMDDAVIHL